jgi:hypothetical protein
MAKIVVASLFEAINLDILIFMKLSISVFAFFVILKVIARENIEIPKDYISKES